jgi:hypothetical protein
MIQISSPLQEYLHELCAELASLLSHKIYRDACEIRYPG